MKKLLKLGGLALLALLAFGIAGLLVLGLALVAYQIYNGRMLYEIEEGSEDDSYTCEESWEEDSLYEGSDIGSSDASSE